MDSALNLLIDTLDAHSLASVKWNQMKVETKVYFFVILWF